MGVKDRDGVSSSTLVLQRGKKTHILLILKVSKGKKKGLFIFSRGNQAVTGSKLVYNLVAHL